MNVAIQFSGLRHWILAIWLMIGDESLWGLVVRRRYCMLCVVVCWLGGVWKLINDLWLLAKRVGMVVVDCWFALVPLSWVRAFFRLEAMLIADKIQVNFSLLAWCSFLSLFIDPHLLPLLNDWLRSMSLSHNISSRRRTTNWICFSMHPTIISVINRLLVNGLDFFLWFVTVDSSSLFVLCPQDFFFQVLVVSYIISFDYRAEHSFLFWCSRVLVWRLFWWMSGLDGTLVYWNLRCNMIIVSLMRPGGRFFWRWIVIPHIVPSYICIIIVLSFFFYILFPIPQQSFRLIFFWHSINIRILLPLILWSFNPLSWPIFLIIGPMLVLFFRQDIFFVRVSIISILL